MKLPSYLDEQMEAVEGLLAKHLRDTISHNRGKYTAYQTAKLMQIVLAGGLRNSNVLVGAVLGSTYAFWAQVLSHISPRSSWEDLDAVGTKAIGEMGAILRTLPV